MPRVFLGNFDFEHELAAGRNWQAGASLRRINAELAYAWLALAGPDDVIIGAGLPDEAFWQRCTEWLGWRPRFELEVANQCRGWELVPWGWSEQAVAWGAQRGLTNCSGVAPRLRNLDSSAQSPPAPSQLPGDASFESAAGDPPPVASVHQVNDRLFSHQLETEWEAGLEGSKVIRSNDELRTQVALLKSERWVLKARFGMSGRERLLGRGDEWPAASQRWLESRLARDGAVVFEPWLEKIAEAGFQWDVPREGMPQFLGMTPLLSDAQGGYRGNRLDNDPTLVDPAWQSAVEFTRRAAERAQNQGYFGPLGVDVMQYRDGTGQVRLRPLQDINARWTMGRLTLGWRRLLQSGECATWLHGPHTDDTTTEGPAGCRLWRTSPRRISGDDCRHTSLLIFAKTAEKRFEAETAICSSGI